MSTLPPTADITNALGHVRFGPTADIATVQKQIQLNTSTVPNGSADHGRKRFKVNFVF